MNKYSMNYILVSSLLVWNLELEFVLKDELINLTMVCPLGSESSTFMTQNTTL